jgi:hypothetical protein
MSKVKTNWHTKPLHEPKTGLALNAYKRFLNNQGLRYETIGLYMGRVGKFLEFAHSIEPHTSKADEFREFLIDQGLSASHINNTCFAIKMNYEMKGIN